MRKNEAWKVGQREWSEAARESAEEELKQKQLQWLILMTCLFLVAGLYFNQEEFFTRAWGEKAHVVAEWTRVQH